MNTGTQKIWDVAVVGGGASGMMAAARAAEVGAKTGLSIILLEKNPTLGVKLLITGGGRCNLTNAQSDVRKFLSKYKDSDKFLFSTFSQFGVQEAIEFFNSRNMPTKVEAENRVFPQSDSAQSVWNVLAEYLKQTNVHIQTGAEVAGFEIAESKSEPTIVSVLLKDKTRVYARKFILATGGTSRPETGSTGDGFAWLSKIGHTVVPANEALVPIALKNMTTWKALQGVTLTDIKLTTFQNNQKQQSNKGKLLFTHFGLSGPTILNMSKDIGELLKYGDVEIRLDLLPTLDHGMLNTRLQELFKTDDKKKIKNSLGSIAALVHTSTATFPASLVSTILSLAGIDPDTQNNSVTRPARIKLIEVLKGMPMQVEGLLGSDKAVVSSGGVDLSEVDFKTMQSRKFPNLYLVGDVLNIDRPSGGYSLQLCWTTGWVAGTNAAAGN